MFSPEARRLHQKVSGNDLILHAKVLFVTMVELAKFGLSCVYPSNMFVKLNGCSLGQNKEIPSSHQFSIIY